MKYWLHPSVCHPPRSIFRDHQYRQLVNEFKTNGWGVGHPMLLGYIWQDDMVQLVTGSYRWHAAIEANIPIPVDIRTYQWVNEIWGTDAWVEWVKNPPLVSTVVLRRKDSFR